MELHAYAKVRVDDVAPTQTELQAWARNVLYGRRDGKPSPGRGQFANKRELLTLSPEVDAVGAQAAKELQHRASNAVLGNAAGLVEYLRVMAQIDTSLNADARPMGLISIPARGKTVSALFGVTEEQ